MFIFQPDAPNPGLILDADAVGVTVVLITRTHQGQEFMRDCVTNDMPRQN